MIAPAEKNFTLVEQAEKAIRNASGDRKSVVRRLLTEYETAVAVSRGTDQGRRQHWTRIARERELALERAVG